MHTRIHSKTYDDEKLIGMRPMDKLCFFYLLGNKRRSLTGLYRLNMVELCRFLQVNSEGEASVYLGELAAAGFILYDMRESVVFVRNFLNYNRVVDSRHMEALIKQFDSSMESSSIYVSSLAYLSHQEWGAEVYTRLIEAGKISEEIIIRVRSYNPSEHPHPAETPTASQLQHFGPSFPPDPPIISSKNSQDILASYLTKYIFHQAEETIYSVAWWCTNFKVNSYISYKEYFLISSANFEKCAERLVRVGEEHGCAGSVSATGGLHYASDENKWVAITTSLLRFPSFGASIVVPRNWVCASAKNLSYFLDQVGNFAPFSPEILLNAIKMSNHSVDLRKEVDNTTLNKVDFTERLNFEHVSKYNNMSTAKSLTECDKIGKPELFGLFLKRDAVEFYKVYHCVNSGIFDLPVIAKGNINVMEISNLTVNVNVLLVEFSQRYPAFKLSGNLSDISAVRKALERALKRGACPLELLNGTESYVLRMNGRGEKICDPVSFLNDGVFERYFNREELEEEASDFKEQYIEGLKAVNAFKSRRGIFMEHLDFITKGNAYCMEVFRISTAKGYPRFLEVESINNREYWNGKVPSLFCFITAAVSVYYLEALGENKIMVMRALRNWLDDKNGGHYTVIDFFGGGVYRKYCDSLLCDDSVFNTINEYGFVPSLLKGEAYKMRVLMEQYIVEGRLHYSGAGKESVSWSF
jgi:hypothetical protein